ncbi:hypothetical protein QYM36_001699 [Artemia franciscana]|uniref:Uncharacterized protein n=1 Tax=Artemia franciscana TaxID=6661 RepID=A0AA88I702_ARTSF|nr:hypothetical protein QYM36_001699 [Artemia franciscana]
MIKSFRADGCSLMLLFNSGASRSLIREGLFRKLTTCVSSYETVEGEFGSITNNPLKYTGTAILTLDLNGRSVPVKVCICRTLPYPMVLGYDAMRENALIFDAESCQVFFRKDVSKDFCDNGFSDIPSLANAIGSVNVVPESEVCCKNIVESVLECHVSPSIRVDSDVSAFPSDSSPSVEMDAGTGLDNSSDSSEGFVVRLVKTEMVPAQSIKRVRVRTQLPEGAKFSLSYFSPVDHSKLLEIDDQLIEIDQSGFFDLLLVNNADQDIQVKKVILGYLYAASENELISDPAGVINHVISVLGIGPQKQAHRLPADMSETEFAELLDLSHVKDEFVRKRFIKLVYRFRDIFATHELHLGACEAVKHTINTGNTPPTKSRPYSVSHALGMCLKKSLILF